MLSELIRPDAGTWDRSATIGASEIGQCARQVYYKKAGLAPEVEEGWGYRTRGHVVEAWVMERLAAGGVVAEHAQQTIALGYLSATVDLIVGQTCVDVKSFDPRKKIVVEPKHVWQVQVQIGLWREVMGRPIEDGLLLYVNCSDYQDIREHPVAADEAAYTAAKVRAAAIMGAVDAPLAEGRIAGGSECRWCPYKTACGTQPAAAPLRPAVISAREEMKRAEAAATAARRRLKEVLQQQDNTGGNAPNQEQ